MKLLLENWRNYLKEGIRDGWDKSMNSGGSDSGAAQTGFELDTGDITSLSDTVLGMFNRTDKIQIYCDMDGVLVDFEQGVVNQINSDLKMLQGRGSPDKLIALRDALEDLDRDYVTLDDLRGKSTAVEALRNYMYARVGDDEEFWANLPWMPNGKRLWDTISHLEPKILTSPMAEGSRRGKQIWIENNLQPMPKEVLMSHEKYKWADENSILIDDWSKNTVPWDEHGGTAIKHTDSQIDQTIQKLMELGAVEK